MKTKVQKRQEAIQRLQNAKWENSKLFRKHNGNEDYRQKWVEQTAAHIEHLEGMSTYVR